MTAELCAAPGPAGLRHATYAGQTRRQLGADEAVGYSYVQFEEVT